jgi:hypothetical protein
MYVTCGIQSPSGKKRKLVYRNTLENVKIKLPVGAPITRPDLANCDVASDSKDISDYNR